MKLRNVATGLAIAVLLTMFVSAQAGEKKLRIAVMPKIVGQPFPTAIGEGCKRAGEELGVEVIFTGPLVADSAQQIEIIEGLLMQRVDAIAIAPNDPSAIAPIFEQAREQGVAVLTFDTDAPDTVRQAFITQALNPDIGNTVLDAMAKDIGGKGEVAIISCGPTAQNLNTWIGYMKEKIKDYPDMSIVDLRYAGEDQQEATRIGLDLIKAYPNLKGIIGPCTPAPPGASEAVIQANKVGSIFVGGVSTPSQMKQYVRQGVSKSFVLWDLNQLGYLTVWAAKELAEGRDLAPVNNVPWIGEVNYNAEDGQVILGKPVVFDASNIDNYNF